MEPGPYEVLIGMMRATGASEMVLKEFIDLLNQLHQDSYDDGWEAGFQMRDDAGPC
jgi:hypothetical protein